MLNVNAMGIMFILQNKLKNILFVNIHTEV